MILHVHILSTLVSRIPLEQRGVVRLWAKSGGERGTSLELVYVLICG